MADEELEDRLAELETAQAVLRALMPRGAGSHHRNILEGHPHRLRRLADIADAPSDGQGLAYVEATGKYKHTTAGTTHSHQHGDITVQTPDQHHAETHLHASHGGIDKDAHHPESHPIASHPDTSATGAQLNAVTDGGEVDAEHTHRLTTYITIGSETGDGISYTV